MSELVSSWFAKPAEETADEIAAQTPEINWGKQAKHFPGHNNFIPGKSELTVDPAKLVKMAGKGEQVGDVPRGLPGSKERINFGEIIGTWVDRAGNRAPTTKGMIIYAKDGVHIYPVEP